MKGRPSRTNARKFSWDCHGENLILILNTHLTLTFEIQTSLACKFFLSSHLLNKGLGSRFIIIIWAKVSRVIRLHQENLQIFSKHLPFPLLLKPTNEMIKVLSLEWMAAPSLHIGYYTMLDMPSLVPFLQVMTVIDAGWYVFYCSSSTRTGVPGKQQGKKRP